MYQKVKTVSSGLGNWQIIRPRFFVLISAYQRLQVEIYLYAEEWNAALALTDQVQGQYAGEEIKAMVAMHIKEPLPHDAIRL